jgi:hypothetical protein
MYHRTAQDGRHIILLGDSVFDNAAYVPTGESLFDQFQAEVPDRWQVTLLAHDGAVIADVAFQLEGLPPGTTDLVISVGGNDALRHAELLERAASLTELRFMLEAVLPTFRNDYVAMLDEVCHHLEPSVCTIYDQCPLGDANYRRRVSVAIGEFNRCITLEAAARNLPLIPLHEICSEPDDFSAISPIEPSGQGAQKIVLAILRQLTSQRR